MPEKFHYECNDCGKTFESNDIIYLCTECEKTNSIDQPPKGVLKVKYDFKKLKKNHTKLSLIERLQKTDYIDLLPIHSTNSLSYLNVGNTPVYEIVSLERKLLNFRLLLKDESQNPTFSFKDRASNLVAAFAKEKNINTIIAASTGNAGSSLAGICASQNQKATIIVPATAPKAKLTQIIMYGATIIPVDGNYDTAFDLSISATKEFGWYNRNTAFNPLTIEGKKTAALEIISQLKTIPDKIFVPVGDGVIISGIFKGFEDLLQLQIIEKMPIIVAVQATGSANLISNLKTDHFKITPSNTLADSISVDIPRNFWMAKKYLQTYKSETVCVTDDEILNASIILSRNTGIFSEPAGACAFAGMLQQLNDERLTPNSKIMVLLTGSGLKDLNSVLSKITLPEPVAPNIAGLKKRLGI